MKFTYELQIDFHKNAEMPYMDLKEGAPWGDDKYVFKNLYYGFRVEDEGYRNDSGFHLSTRTFRMDGTEDETKLKTTLVQLLKEVSDSSNVPNTFRKALGLLVSLLSSQLSQQIEENVEYETSRWYGEFGVRVYLRSIPEEKKEPKADLIVKNKLYKATVKYVFGDEEKPRTVEGWDTAPNKIEAAKKATSDTIAALEKYKSVLSKNYKILNITIEELGEVSVPITFVNC